MNTTSVKVFETRNSTYKCGNGTGDTLRFQIPPNVALLNPDQTYLKFDFCLGDNKTGPQAGYVAGNVAKTEYYAPWTLNSKIGAEALIKELTISHNGQVLEQYFGYNMLCRVMSNYTHNESMDNVVKLYKGGDSRFVRTKNTLTSRTQNPAGTSKVGETQSLKRVECIVPLSLSGIFNGSQPFPNMVCPLEVQILLEDDSYKFLQVQGHDLGSQANPASKNVQNLVAGYGAEMPYGVVAFDVGYNQNGNTKCTLNRSTAVLPQINQEPLSDVSEVADFPFWVGQQLEIVASDGTKVVQVSKCEGDVGGGFTITFGANLDLAGNTTQNPPIYVKEPAQKPQATLSNVELICGVIQPNEQQSKALMSAVSSSGGYALDYKTYTDFPINQAQSVLKQSNLINCKLSRTKAIISYNEDVGNVSTIESDNLTPPLDSDTQPKQYQFRLNNILVPNRAVHLDNYNKSRATTGEWEAIHIKELEDALEACGFVVRDLTDIDGALALGRGLSRGNNTYNMMNAQGETRLNVDYDTQNRSLLVHNWVCNIKRLVIKPNGIMVME